MRLIEVKNILYPSFVPPKIKQIMYLFKNYKDLKKRFFMSKIIKQILFLLFVFLFFFTTLTCKRSPIEPNGSEMLWLEFEDASCTEAWFNLRLNNLPKPVRVDVYRENYLTKSFTISATNDTLFYIENLLPKQKYDVYVKVRGSDGKEYTSTKVNFETMDTTSHEFSWQIFEFGEKGNSVLYDVAIIDENNIWAVGEIYTKDTYTYDSLGNWIQPYNAVHWDGTKWELKRIYTYSSCSSVDYAPLKAIYAFSHNKIVVTSGGGMWWFNGNNWNAECSINPLLTGAINKLWGSSSSDLYAVGNNGNIAHWDGRKWTKIESGTTLNINDIWGDYNEKTGQWEILAVCGNILHGQESEREILKVKNNLSCKNYQFYEY